MLKQYLWAFKLAAGLIVVVAAVASAWYVQTLRTNLTAAQESVKTLAEVVEVQKKTILEIQADIVAVKEADRAVSSVVSRAQKDLVALRSRFETNVAGKPRDLGNLAVAKPASVEAAINRGSEQAARCMEIASGSALTAAELAASKPSEINPLCPGLANPNYVAR